MLHPSFVHASCKVTQLGANSRKKLLPSEHGPMYLLRVCPSLGQGPQWQPDPQIQASGASARHQKRIQEEKKSGFLFSLVFVCPPERPFPRAPELLAFHAICAGAGYPLLGAPLALRVSPFLLFVSGLNISWEAQLEWRMALEE